MSESDHPSSDQLRAFVAGRLRGAEAEAIEKHLPDCMACVNELEHIAGETAVGGSMVMALRQAQVAVPAAADVDATHVPRELREHARYSITSRLGSGGMGAVYLAEHKLLERPVVIKVIRPDLLHRPGLADRFLREAKLAARLSHPNIVTVHEAEQTGRIVLLVMEYVAGETFAELVRKRGPAPVRVACEMIRQAALGVQHIHEQKLVHRDIKPSNLMLTSAGEVKLLDLGLAFLKTDDPSENRELTRPEQSMGTVDYTAPEQWENSHGVDIRADIYSLGCTFYYLLTGTPPYAGSGSAMPNLMRQIWAHSLAPVPDVRHARPDIPQGVSAILTRMLSKKPVDRFNVPGEVARALTPFAAGGDPATYFAGGQPLVQARAIAPAVTAPVNDPLRNKLSRRGMVFGLAATAAAIAVGGGVLALRKLGGQGTSSGSAAAAGFHGPPLRIGVLHSLSGTMAISERSVLDATLLAVEELNGAGGVLGRRVEAVVADGASDDSIFAAQAEKLIGDEKVVTVFGCWTSASRRTVRPIFEKHDHLLFYPVQYEGLEQSPNIVYTGAAPNQQILPAVRWCTTVLNKRRLFLIGSDYVFPRCANAIIRDRAATLGAEIVGECYLTLGGQDFTDAIKTIATVKPDMILNTINGDSNVAFFRALQAVRSTTSDMPVMSFSIAEEELSSLNAKAIAGDYAAWNYFMSIARPMNRAFVDRFRTRYGAQRVLTDPMEAGYFGVHLWAQAVTKAGVADVRAIRAAIGGQTMDAPEGVVAIDAATQHTSKLFRIGKIVESSEFEIVYTSENPIVPEPYPTSRTPDEWRKFLEQLYDSWGGHWSKQAV